ncbi:MAG TPA: 3-hydroxyisobutyrate dehydrogenase [Hyphomicrobiaceae bacterium]|jgi:3-hydroxyisobutyrate dehydrogenase|nr:3-hydroxyisobutyrate dehydrogenase [Hyphomicrobiaceae bacterium]
MARIGFIGLGNMGLPMAGNLVKAGHAVAGFDLLGENLERAAGRGVNPERSAPDAAKDAEIVVTMLPAGKQVLEVYQAGVLGAARANTLFIDSSTIDVASARAAHQLATQAGMLGLDAPVSGGVGGAEAASLTFMAGGTAAAFAQAKPILESMGRRVIHCGDAGAGQAAKICNNMMLGINMIGVSEAFTLAEKLGLSPKALFDVAAASSGQSWALTSYCPVPGLVPAAPANNNYKPGFASALMLKDLRLAQEAAAVAGASTPLGAAAAQLFGLHNAWGEGGTDFSGIIHLLRGRGGQ